MQKSRLSWLYLQTETISDNDETDELSYLMQGLYFPNMCIKFAVYMGISMFLIPFWVKSANLV